MEELLAKMDWTNPTPEDLEKIRGLSVGDREKLLVKLSDQGATSGDSGKTLEDIFAEALKKSHRAA